MNTKNLVLMSLLVAVGAALYLVIPGFNGGMKPDFMLTMMFIGILLFPDVRSVFLLAISTGVISGLFSTFPLGFFPNIVDKLITAFVIYAVIISLKKVAKNLIVRLLLLDLVLCFQDLFFYRSQFLFWVWNFQFHSVLYL